MSRAPGIRIEGGLTRPGVFWAVSRRPGRGFRLEEQMVAGRQLPRFATAPAVADQAFPRPGITQATGARGRGGEASRGGVLGSPGPSGT